MSFYDVVYARDSHVVTNMVVIQLQKEMVPRSRCGSGTKSTKIGMGTMSSDARDESLTSVVS